MDLSNTLVMTGLLFPRIYYFFLVAWCSSSFRQNSKHNCGLFKVNFRESINLSFSNFLKSFYMTTFGGCLRKCVFKTETVILWKSDNPVSITHVLWKDWGFLVKIKSIQLGFSGFLKHVGCLSLVPTAAITFVALGDEIWLPQFIAQSSSPDFPLELPTFSAKLIAFYKMGFSQV